MAKKSNVILIIINIVELILTIVTIILTKKISDKTEENPLEEYEKNIENMFDDEDDAITDNAENTIIEVTTIVSEDLKKLSKFCQCGESVLDNICTEEQIASGCYDVSKNYKNTPLRYLKENCDQKKENVVDKGGLSKAFDLNYNTVSRMADLIFFCSIVLIISLCLIIFSLFSVIIPCECCEAIGVMALIFYCLSLVVNLICPIIMIIKYYSGDARQFLDFYEDCLKGEDKVMNLQKAYKKMNNINKYMTAFVCLFSFHIGLNIIEVVILIKKIKKARAEKKRKSIR